jgi:hypothetical protein
MEFYSAMKKHEILSFSGKWMELENIMLSELSQVQKTKIACFLSYMEDRPKYKFYIYIYVQWDSYRRLG